MVVHDHDTTNLSVRAPERELAARQGE